jgi:hypothetical protein
MKGEWDDLIEQKIIEFEKSDPDRARKLREAYERFLEAEERLMEMEPPPSLRRCSTIRGIEWEWVMMDESDD